MRMQLFDGRPPLIYGATHCMLGNANDLLSL